MAEDQSTKKAGFTDGVRDIEERFEYYRDQRDPILLKTRDYWDLYLGKRKEFRLKGEEWRANLHIPKPFANIRTKTANLASILLAGDPLIQPEAIHDEGLETTPPILRLFDYTHRKNEILKSTVKLLDMRAIVGTSFYTWTWVEEAHEIFIPQSQAAVARFMEQLVEIQSQYANVAMTMPDWQKDPEAFDKWRKLNNDAGPGYPAVPERPQFGKQQLVRYRGPRLVILRPDDIYLDPLIDEIPDQYCVIRRAVKPRSWLEAKVKQGVYDKAAVEFAMDGWDGKTLEDESEQLALKMGIADPGDKQADPFYKDAVEVWEVWQLKDKERPFQVILNRKARINPYPERVPFWHGECAIGATRATVVPGHFYGISDLDAPRDLFWETNRFRSLRLDAATLNTLPAFTKLTEVGLPESFTKIRPGDMIPVRRENAIQALVRQPLPPEAYREPQEMGADADDAMGIYGSTRGREASVGRVTGTEYSGREERANIRIKLDALWFDEDFAPRSHRQILALYAQKSDGELRLRIGGKPDPFLKLSRETLLEALDMNWRLRGPLNAIRVDMKLQNFYMWVKSFGAQLMPSEFRFAAKLALDWLDVRGASRLVTDEGTAQKTNEYQMALQAQGMQMNAANQSASATVQPPPPGQQAPAPPPQTAGAPPAQ